MFTGNSFIEGLIRFLLQAVYFYALQNAGLLVKGSQNTILDTIGNTPLVFLKEASATLNIKAYAKLEGCNPGHSAKDRMAAYIISLAETEGRLKPGATIIESSSGNTGRSLAMVAALKGYRCIICTTTKISQEKKSVLEAYGAEVVVCPKGVKADDPRSYYSQARQLAQQIPGALHINQYANQANVEAHYRSTGPELWQQTGGQLQHFICCVGTGGTISGVSRYLKKQNRAIRVWGVDAKGSVLTKYAREGILDEAEIQPYQLEGVGKDIIPATVDFQKIDQFIQVEDQPSLQRALTLARQEAILVGPSGGAALEGLYQLKDAFKPGAYVVVLIPDHGISYLSKLYNQAWMQKNGFA